MKRISPTNGSRPTGAGEGPRPQAPPPVYKPSVRPLIALQKPNYKHNKQHVSPKPVVPQIPPPNAQYVPLSLPPIAGQPYHGPPPYLFSYPSPQQGFGNFPIGPIKPFDQIFRPPPPQQSPAHVSPVQYMPIPLDSVQQPQHHTGGGGGTDAQSSPIDNLHAGFVPMLIKTANQSIVKHFEHKSQHNTPSRQGVLAPGAISNTGSDNSGTSNPFSKNNSVPFAPTFRAPSPDFSGFNISRYGELAPSSKLGAGMRPIQLTKPLVPINKHPNTVAADRVNIPLRYRLKPQGQDAPVYQPGAANGGGNRLSGVGHPYGHYLDDSYDPNEEYMIAVERGSQSAESQSTHTVMNASVQDFN
ncbi:unnamed protein product, partial [Medioppia subpectinata]